MYRTYRTMNKRLLIMGCDRQMWLAGLFIGLGLFLSTSSLLVGFTVFFVFALLGFWQAKDPVKLKMIFNRGQYRRMYDPALRKPFYLVIR